MSEQIDLNTNNLCTTEDAFEKFQSVSMYEEDEFITLSDIVPPQPERPALQLELNDIPYENEVVLEQYQEQVPEVNSTIESGSEESKTFIPRSSVEESAKQTPLGAVKTSRSPRGRKKKIQHNPQDESTNDTTTTAIESNNGISQNMAKECESISTPPTVTKRGRRPRKTYYEYLEETYTEEIEKISKKDRRRPAAKITDSTLEGSETLKHPIENKNGTKKQGKAKKLPVDKNVSNDFTKSDVSNIKDESLVETGNINEKKTSKRGRRKKIISNKFVQDEEDTTVKNDDTDNKPVQTNDVETPVDEIKKIPGKRGRRPKKVTEKESVIDEVLQNEPFTADTTDSKADTNKTEPYEEDVDDICLSKLKKTLEPTDVVSDDVTMAAVEENLSDKPNQENENQIVDVIKNNDEIKNNEDIKNIEGIKTSEDIDNCEDIKNSEEIKENENNAVENLDEVVKSDVNNDQMELEDDVSKRPVRRKARKNLHYDESSDEDPFANIELSDEEPRRKKGGKFYSDDEYVPGDRKRGNVSSTDVSDSDIDTGVDELLLQRKKKKRFDLSPSKTPKKRGRKRKDSIKGKFSPELGVNSNDGDDNTAGSFGSSVSKANKFTNEFENFIARKIQGTDIKIKKASTVQQKLEIPVLDPNDVKKAIDNSTQTTIVKTSSVEVQTTAPHDVPMKDNVPLSEEQSVKACEFLNGIVKTTAELGELMTQKSEDFIKKKINTANVTDTFKMDYCVRKSFLLFKLAKHNLMQMEEDLAKQYDEFLNSNNLMQYRESPKVLSAKARDSDSDCEIIDAPTSVSQSSMKLKKPPSKEKPKFNPKTVFLNKELSIKIAKKPSDDKKLNIKGRHTVWLNDSVMVKKIKPTHSFLAQDSRNKKPPDCVTIEMVNNFFKDYYRQQAIMTCAPFITTEWLYFKKKYVSSYFFPKADDFSATTLNTEIPGSSQLIISSSVTASYLKHSCFTNSLQEGSEYSSPKTLFTLCTEALQSHIYGLTLPSQENSRKYNDEKILHLNEPKTLYSLSVKCLNNNIHDKLSLTSRKSSNMTTASSLKTLSYKRVLELFHDYYKQPEIGSLENYESYEESCNDDDSILISDECEETLTVSGNFQFDHIKKLSTLCVEYFQDVLKIQVDFETNTEKALEQKILYKPQSLQQLTFENISKLMYNISMTNKPSERLVNTNNNICILKKVKSLSDLCFELVTKCFAENGDQTSKEGLTINSVNTLTEEAYLNIEESTDITENPEYYGDEETNFYEDDFENFEETNEEDGDNWLSQVELKELKSCFVPTKTKDTEKQLPEENRNSQNDEAIVTRIKIEPELDDVADVIDTSIIKTEPLHNLDEMTIIPESIITKSEMIEPAARVQRVDSASYDVDSFETFVSNNKMMHAINEYRNPEEEVFSQSASRVRRQFEPDWDTENDIGMDLLVPQTFEPLPIETVKGCLMESSDDESSTAKKNTGKKKPEKRKSRAKKTDLTVDKTSIAIKTVSKDTPIATSEIAILTRRMRERIRQEEKKIESSDSDTEDLSVVSKKSKDKESSKETTLTTDTESTDSKKNKTNNIASCSSKKGKDVSKDTNLNNAKIKDTGKDSVSKTKQKIDTATEDDDEIQCNNVDSTEQIVENLHDKSVSPDFSLANNKFQGFSVLDQNEVSNYQKYVKYVYDKILPSASETGDSESIKNDSLSEENADTPLINPQEPVELLECEPSIPMFFENQPKTSKHSRKESAKKKSPPEITEEKDIKTEPLTYTERYGWKCYQLDGTDTKLYQNAQVALEKLPETFVETYFMYQDITDRNKEDDEVDRLINLQTLNRPAQKEGKCKKGRPKSKIRPQDTQALERNNITRSRSPSPADSDRYDELTPSEDEGGDNDEETSVPRDKPAPTENNMAKNLLMDDHESENEENKSEVKVEPEDPDEKQSKMSKKSKPGPKSKKALEKVSPESLMLTADKMMNKELNLLHAPIVLDDSSTKTPSKGPVTRKQKSSSKAASDSKRVKLEEDSSSEEEKQWFTIKEKLLRKMINKKDTTREDDAKRSKLVSEFIERRGETAENYLKRRRGRSGRRSRKKMLERQKQLRVLSRELFGDPSNDASHQAKGRNTGTYFKGRRNIRKVIDKKSLAKSTVLANMEEFERKRRLSIRQNKLREILQCEDGVNVLVINDEVCLEYDFEQHRPVVTIHPFFTKVMKAHQYEGVKFMWDACFESLETVAAGRPGGGCILAHCMGLGKTLQVLALLHTVLTHPRVGMKRVLVCCPLSTVLNWVDEIHKWIGPVTDQIKVFELSKLKKTYERAYQLEDWYNGGGIFIIGYELFRSLTTLDPFLDDVRPTIINKIRTALLDPGPDIIICDEGHLLKNDSSVLAVAMSRVATKRRIVLTGTPMQNNLREYYCMVNFVKPDLLGTYSEYSNRFENPIMNGQHRDSREEDIKLMKARTHILHKVLEGCLQRQEASVLYPYLPKKHEYTVFISLTKCQWDLYKHYLQNYASKQNYKSILKDFHILQKIWSHPQVLHNFQMRSRDEKTKVKVEKLEDDLAREDLNADNPSEDIKPTDTEVWWLQYLEGGQMLDSLESSNKFAAVFRILDESIALGDKVLIFSTSLVTMDALEYFLKKMNNWSLGQEYYRLDGSVPPEVRQKWCREFNAENNVKTKLFLISTRAGSLGLNMTAANRVIILDTSWNPAHDIQSIFRVYRFGQKKDCYIYRLVAMGTMEQKIYERSVTKQAVACRVVDEQQIDRHYNMAELTELYKFDETGLGVAGGVAVGVEDVVLLRVARHASLHAVHEHDSLLRGSAEQGLPEHERNAAWMQFQQEHAHKQMQNDLENAAIKQIHDAKLAAEAKIKIKAEKNETPTPTPAPATETKSRRGRKSATVNCCIPIQPEGTVTDDKPPVPPKDEQLFKQISQILLKHNFQNKLDQHETSALIANVREIVASGRMDLLANADELTASIASVLLYKLDKPQMPPLTNIKIEPEKDYHNEPSTSAMAEQATPKPRIRGRIKGKRKGYVYEEIPPQEPTKEVEDDTDGRKRRRAAIAAEKNFDSITQSVIDVDDDSDAEFVPERHQLLSLVKEESDDIIVDKRSKNDKSKSNDEKHKPETDIPVKCKDEKQKQGKKSKEMKSQNEGVELIKEQTKSLYKEVNSILLSDDEDDAPLTKKVEPTPKTKSRKQKLAEEREKKVEEEDEGPIPLHPSLLSNQNFIKIVAHTYLTGNPMLDEDAATLAAQYSTNKALKEYESTGKQIESGPIYDIAVKVLGLNVLKKLHNTKIPAPTRSSSSQSTPQKEVEKEPEPEAASKQKPIKLKIRVPSEITREVVDDVVQIDSPPLLTPSLSSNVVPVGLFKGPANTMSLTTDECILPDDDDIIISDSPPSTPYRPPPPLASYQPPPSPTPQQPTTPLAIPTKPIILKMGRKNSQSLILNSVRAESRSVPEVEEAKTTVPPSSPPPLVPRSPAPQPADPERMLTENTISLDSDDEDEALSSTTAVFSAAPVPVALTAAPPPAGPPAPGPRLVTRSFLQRVAVTTKGSSAQPIVLFAPPTPAPLAPAPAPAPAPAATKLHRVAEIPSGVVPVALSKVQTTPVPSFSKIAPAPPTPPPAPTDNSNAVKRFCRPGDILRITSSGQIEVLNQIEKSRHEEKSTNQANTSERNTRKQFTSTDDARARPSSPPAYDPLSILKDVVHIEADDYAVPAPASGTTPQKDPAVKTAAATAQSRLISISCGEMEMPPTIDVSKPLGSWNSVLSHRDTKSSTTPRANKTNSASASTSSASKIITVSTTGTTRTSKNSTLATSRTPTTTSTSRTSNTSTPSTSRTSSASTSTSRTLSKPPTASKAKATATSGTNRTYITITASKTKQNEKTNNAVINLTSEIKKPDNIKPKERFLGSVDLTDVDSTFGHKKGNDTTDRKQKQKPKTIVGTSKSIIITGKGKALTKMPVNEPAAKKVLPTTSQDLGKASAVKGGALEVKKRPPAPTDTPTAKKKKTEKPLTLKDFNIDDIDDIIELD